MNPEEEAQFIENRRLVSRAIKILSANTNQNHRHRVSQLRILFGVTIDRRGGNGGLNRKMTKSI